jgi:hypothetical protein
MDSVIIIQPEPSSLDEIWKRYKKARADHEEYIAGDCRRTYVTDEQMEFEGHALDDVRDLLAEIDRRDEALRFTPVGRGLPVYDEAEDMPMVEVLCERGRDAVSGLCPLGADGLAQVARRRPVPDHALALSHHVG